MMTASSRQKPLPSRKRKLAAAVRLWVPLMLVASPSTAASSAGFQPAEAAFCSPQRRGPRHRRANFPPPHRARRRVTLLSAASPPPPPSRQPGRAYPSSGLTGTTSASRSAKGTKGRRKGKRTLRVVGQQQPRGRQDKKWNRMIGKLRAFRDEHGHFFLILFSIESFRVLTIAHNLFAVLHMHAFLPHGGHSEFS